MEDAAALLQALEQGVAGTGAAIHEWFKTQESGLPGPGRGER